MKFIFKRFGVEDNPRKERKEKNKIKRQIILFFFLFVIFALFTSFVIAKILQCKIINFSVNNELESMWIGSLASYLGGTIGGVFSGAFAFLGVFYTIKYYKDSDEEKEKKSIQPFLLISPGAKNTPTKGFSYDNDSNKSDDKENLYLTIKNIGNGFANILVVHTRYNFGGLKYNEILCVGDEAYICLAVNPETLKSEFDFSIQFVDAMRNEYIQSYTVNYNHGSTTIESGYPTYLRQL